MRCQPVPDRILRRSAWLLTLVLLAVTAGLLLARSAQSRDRAHDLEERLRCPTCQSVSVADSPSDTAQAMRDAVRQQVDAGRSDDEILGYFQDRYGRWVLLDPPARGTTLLLWALPALAVVVAALAVARLVRPPQAGAPLSTEERERVRAEADRVVSSEEEP